MAGVGISWLPLADTSFQPKSSATMTTILSFVVLVKSLAVASVFSSFPQLVKRRDRPVSVNAPSVTQLFFIKCLLLKILTIYCHLLHGWRVCLQRKNVLINDLLGGV